MSDPLLSIHFQNTSNRRIAAYPVTYGIPFPEGVLREAAGLGIRLAGGRMRRLQTQVLETWTDGSIKWLLLDFEVPLEPNETGVATLVRENTPPAGNDLRLEESAEVITVTTSKLVARFNRRRFSFFDSYVADGKEMVAEGSDVVVEDPDGKRYYASLSKELDVRVIVQGPQRVVIQASGRHTAEDGVEMLSFRVRYTFHPNEPGVGIAYRFTNREAPETGVTLASIQAVVPTRLGCTTTKTIRQTNHGKDWYSRQVEVKENVEVVCGLTLVDPKTTHYGVSTQGKVLLRNFSSLRENLDEYPHFLRPGNPRTDSAGGLRAVYPYVGVNGEAASLVAWFYDMENNFPKGLRCDRNVFSFDVWPAFAGPLRVRRGQSKEHEMHLSFAGRTREPLEMEGIYFDHEIVGVGIYGATNRPLMLTLDPQYVRDCRILQLHRWLPCEPRRYTVIETKLKSTDPSRQMASKGMWDFGDYVGPDRSWCRNNENDAILDGIREYYRRQDPGELLHAIRQARHNAHVDFITHDPDPLRQGAMPAHCPEHTDGATYPSHMWVDGLLAAYDITGETDFLEAALSVGENMLRWQHEFPIVFYSDSRECGWPMLAYLRLHEYTKSAKWLEACEEVFEFYRKRMGADGMIRYELPHGVGTVVAGYGEFIAWRSLFHYYERTNRKEVKEFLVRCLDQVYRREPGPMSGWACNDLFPAWAAYALTGEDRYIEDNYTFLQFLMDLPGSFPWGGVDLQFYFGELHRRGALDGFCRRPESFRTKVEKSKHRSPAETEPDRE
jgi:hypothetical protein